MNFWTNVISTLTSVTNFGLSLVISSVAIYLFVYWFKIYIKSKAELEKKKIDKELPRVTDRDLKIRQLLFELLHEVAADRTYVFQYHNSGIFRSGIGYLKSSNTHEVVAKGILPQIQLLQNLPISMFALWNHNILNHQPIIYNNLEQVKKEDLATYESFVDQGIKSVYSIGLYDINDMPMGFLGVDFNKEEVTLTSEQFEQIENKAYKVAGLLYT